MFRDLSKFSWVHSLIECKDQLSLIGDVQEKIIDPAEKKHTEIEEWKKYFWS